MNIIRIKETASTNAYLRELISGVELSRNAAGSTNALPEGTVVVAERQTDGRGQTGNAWEAEAGKNLTFSLLLKPVFLPVEQHFLLSEAVALGVWFVLQEYVSSTMLTDRSVALTDPVVERSRNAVTIKWSNDIYVGDRKIAGILIENELTGCEISQSIVGIGLNVNQKTFLSDAPNPVSLYQILGRETDLDKLLETIVECILIWYEQLKKTVIERSRNIVSLAYHQNLYRRDGFYNYKDKNGVFRAKIKFVSPEGYLILQTAGSTTGGETRSYEIKEVAFV